VSEAGGRSGTAARDGWYVYGVVAARSPDGLWAETEAVAGGAVSLVKAGRLAAIVSQVPLSEFGEVALIDNLRDAEWLEERVRAHERVLEAALDIGVVPFRFGTIYSGEEQVRAMLGDHPELEDDLDRVGDKVELGVKGFLAAPASKKREQLAVSSGRGYLEAKQEARRLAEEQQALAAQNAREAHERFASLAEEAAANPVQAREVTGRNDKMFLNGAYLVATDLQGEFRAAVSALGAEHGSAGISYELTGPWPPYNFVGEIT
jgi:Gas vesicle synthesis protein GvpL/GvpF